MRKAKHLSKDAADGTILMMGIDIRTGLSSAYFDSLVSEKAAFLQTYDTFAVALPKAVSGGRQDKAIKNTARKQFISAANELCDAVNRIARGNMVILSASGFKLSPQPSPITMKHLKQFTVANTKVNGQVRFLAVKSEGTLSITIKYGIGDTWEEITHWKTSTQSTNECIISNLPSGKRIWGIATSTGRRKQVLRSLPVNTIIL